MDSFAVVDIETTGLEPDRDEIIEVGAVRVEGGRITQTFSQLVRPTIELPLWSQRITGIRPADLEGKPPIETALMSLATFVGDLPVIAHNASFEREFLSPFRCCKFAPAILDSLELARIALPQLPRHNLETLIRHFELAPCEEHRAAGDAALTALVWLKLIERLCDLPVAVLSQMAPIASRAGSRLSDIIASARETARGRSAKKTGAAASTDIASILPNFENEVGRRAPRRPEHAQPTPLEVASVTELLESGQALERSLENFERRPEQLKMAAMVTDAFNKRLILAAEAGTGTGKSMAYLIPAALWAEQNDERVVISTNTKNLQEQLVHKDIPLLEKTLGRSIRHAIAKGRSNYLCVFKLVELLNELNDENVTKDALEVLPLLSWAAQTATGDVSENGSFSSARSRQLWDRLWSSGDDCGGRQCSYFNNCFLMRARQKVQEAMIVIANHSVIFSDIATSGAVLPDYAYLILDEAHNVEQVATEQMRVELGRLRVVRVLARLYRPSRRPHGSGLIPRVIYETAGSEAADDQSSSSSLTGQCKGAIEYARRLTADVERLDGEIAALFARHGREERVRYGKGDRPPAAWEPLERTADQIVADIAGISSAITFIAARLTDLDKGMLPFRNERIRELLGAVGQLNEIAGDAKMLVAAVEQGYVYWAERSGGGRGKPFHLLCAAPLLVRRMMKEHLYDRKAAIVMTSATMSVKNSFEFILGRLGLDQLPEGRLMTAIMGSSFDYDKQTMAALANFLPPPTQSPQFEKAVARLLIDVHRRTGGRGLVLFTSHEMLQRVYNLVKPALERDGLLVMGQGIDGSRRALTEIFRKDTSSVLLGTASFWEGVDIVGDSLTCLTLVRLPFQVVDDPVTAARCKQIEEDGQDPFTHYTVPNAVIRFRQGFGRLIRSRSDRGVVIIADKRAKTKPYGSSFLNSLPTRVVPYPSAAELIEAIGRFLG